MEFMEALDYNHIHLAIVAIEKGAQLLNIPAKEMYERLKKQGLIHRFLLAHYEELHTQSQEWVADATVEALKNWEAASGLNR